MVTLSLILIACSLWFGIGIAADRTMFAGRQSRSYRRLMVYRLALGGPVAWTIAAYEAIEPKLRRR
jgi:hypothetical protein